HRRRRHPVRIPVQRVLPRIRIHPRPRRPKRLRPPHPKPNKHSRQQHPPTPLPSFISHAQQTTRCHNAAHKRLSRLKLSHNNRCPSPETPSEFPNAPATPASLSYPRIPLKQPQSPVNPRRTYTAPKKIEFFSPCFPRGASMGS